MTATIDCGQGDWVSVDHWDNGATISESRSASMVISLPRRSFEKPPTF